MARRILLADDSVTAQNMGRKILTEAGYEVITVNNGSAALKRVAEQKPDIIVLDVYMPGYGGLEVCHRLKENPETSRIPVLLTVGKLEPFKVEESRRVRADMHIVKPFDTSELLSAIAKLEDRIVAQSEMPKKGRFAKADDAPPPDSYGDQNSGWKSRLIAPRKKAKAEKSEAKTEVPEEIKETVQAEPPRPRNSDEDFEEDSVSTKDWRTLLSAREAEERVAATKARHETNEVAPQEEKPGAKTKSEGQGAPAIVAESAADIVARAAAAVKAEDTDVERVELREASHTSAAQPPVVTAEQTQEQAEGKGHERDVADALASLVPAAGTPVSESVNDRELVGAGGQAERAGGPRWTAQAVLVSQEESSSLLDQEMERAFKHFAAEPPATFVMGPLEAMSFNVPSEEEELSPRHAHSEPALPIEPTAPVAEAQPAASEPESEAQPSAAVASKAETTAPAEANPNEARAAAEEESGAPASIMGALWMSTPPAYVAATSGPPKEIPQEPDASVEPSASETTAAEVAFAAAASASAASSAVESEPPRVESACKESELAAAWQNWRQDHGTESQPDAEPSPQPQVTSESSNEDEPHGEEISSLVDTMLAELKPKLMKEIAKKMGKEKEKDKEKSKR